MKKFKLRDAWISITLISGFMIASFVRRDETFLWGYIFVGTWQVISMVVHAWNKWFTKKGSRKAYHWIAFISVITMPAGSIFVLYFTAPVMAIYYTWLCCDEVYIKMRRPISILK